MILLPVNKVLNELKHVVNSIDAHLYTIPVKELSGSSIGGHTRHVIELFQCLVSQYETGVVNYDIRKRDKQIETDSEFAALCIERILLAIGLKDKKLSLLTDLHGNNISIETTYHRELFHNYDHCVHHQALIKVGLISLGWEFTMPDGFGIASSTQKFRNICAR